MSRYIPSVSNWDLMDILLLTLLLSPLPPSAELPDAACSSSFFRMVSMTTPLATFTVEQRYPSAG